MPYLTKKQETYPLATLITPDNRGGGRDMFANPHRVQSFEGIPPSVFLYFQPAIGRSALSGTNCHSLRTLKDLNGLERIRTFYLQPFRGAPLLCDHQSVSKIQKVRPHIGHCTQLDYIKADWRGLEPSICDYFNASLPNLRPSIRL